MSIGLPREPSTRARGGTARRSARNRRSGLLGRASRRPGFLFLRIGAAAGGRAFLGGPFVRQGHAEIGLVARPEDPPIHLEHLGGLRLPRDLPPHARPPPL